jgi:hypothetical protein
MSESSPHPSHAKPMLSDRKYNLLKKTATIVLPAIGALYFALAQIWQLPKTEEVVGTIAALNTFLGALIQVSKKSYYNNSGQYVGEINIEDSPDGTKKVFSLDLSENPEALETKDEVIFKINRQ